MRKILFITGTRADYGKVKPLIKALESENDYEVFIFVSGMHLIEKLGNTYKEVLKDKYKNVYIDFAQANRGIMSYDLGNIICDLTGYIKRISPDMIVVHGDRIDALAGAVVGALNNIKVAHIEGGEVSGTIDESIRHAISKFAHIHLVCNEEAKKRLIQLGEEEKRIYVIGSPDIDIMLSNGLPSLEEAKKRYNIHFDKYGIFMYHPVTTEYSMLAEKIRKVVSALLSSGKNYIVVYPNNDLGSELILDEYNRLKSNSAFAIFPSLRFEYFLTLLKNAEFMIGNSSAGIRETSIYGIPAIDVGSRQTGRYSSQESNIQHVEEEEDEIENAILRYKQYRKTNHFYGEGNSTEKFLQIIKEEELWQFEIQKRFIDISSTL